MSYPCIEQTLFATVKARSMEVTARTVFGQNYTVRVDSSDNVLCLKRQLSLQLESLAHCQLFFKVR